jgi:hypothetical protein
MPFFKIIALLREANTLVPLRFRHSPNGFHFAPTSLIVFIRAFQHSRISSHSCGSRHSDAKKNFVANFVDLKSLCSAFFLTALPIVPSSNIPVLQHSIIPFQVTPRGRVQLPLITVF